MALTIQKKFKQNVLRNGERCFSERTEKDLK